MGKYTPLTGWLGIKEDLNSSEIWKDCLKINALLSAGIIAGTLLVGSLKHYFTTHDIVPRDQVVHSVQIDRDELSDLVIGDKILLADQTDNGIVYRQLNDTDIYRIQ